MKNFVLRRFNLACHSPCLYLKKILLRFFRIDDAWLQESRNDCPLRSWQWLALTEKLYGGFKV